jgi:Protein of unknown function, DUF547
VHDGAFTAMASPCCFLLLYIALYFTRTHVHEYRIVLYEKLGPQKEHLQALNNYALKLEMTYLGHGANSSDVSDEESLQDVVNSSAEVNMLSEYDNLRSDSPSHASMSFHDDGEEFYDANESESQHTINANPPAATRTEEPLLLRVNKAVPMYIDVISNRSGYVRAYAFVTNSKLRLIPKDTVDDSIRTTEAGRIYRQRVHSLYSPRLSSDEKKRRTVGLAVVQDASVAKLVDGMEGGYEGSLLHHIAPSFASSSFPASYLSCYVARAMSEHHWVEEWCVLTDRHVSFHQFDKKTVHFQIHLDSVLGVHKMEQDAPYIPDTSFLMVATLGRSVYVMFDSESVRDQWHDKIAHLIANMRSDASVASFYQSNESYNFASEYMHQSSKWHCKGRRILNCAKFIIPPNNADSPLDLVERALRLSSQPMADNDFKARRQFLESAAALKGARLDSIPSENARAAFFLNLYHLMINHAYMILGVPSSSRKWISFFNHVAYEVADEVFSLAEMEHNIIRANMAFPSQFLSRFVIPKSSYAIALRRADYRYNFALNCGSLCNPSGVFVYNAESLDDQLDAACRLYLQDVAVTRKRGKELQVNLPRICQWFADDFGSSRDLLTKCLPYIRKDERAKLDGCTSSADGGLDMSRISIKYDEYNFTCAPLVLLEDKEAPAA